MPASIVYQNPLIYEAAMLALYGRHYPVRYRVVADLIPPQSSVVDVCCGPAILYDRYLRCKLIQYTGLDMSESFVRHLTKRGITARLWDVRSDAPLPRADYVIMQASLCHFLPNAHPVLQRMLAAAREKVIIAEPVRNISSSRVRFIAAAGRRFTDPGDGRSQYRFTEETLDDFFVPYLSRISLVTLIPGGREKVFVLESDAKQQSA